MDFPSQIILIGSRKGKRKDGRLVNERAIGNWLASMSKLSHVDESGRVRMVDTSDKANSTRRAIASASVLMTSETVKALTEHRSPKGDPLEAARLAGIMAAKKTAELIPLCHPLPLTHIDVRAELTSTGVSLQAVVATNAQTGVEMEALTAVSVAALTISILQGCGKVDHDYEILLSERVAKSWHYERTH